MKSNNQINHLAALHECCEVNERGWGTDNVMSQADFISKINKMKMALAYAVVERLKRGEGVYLRAKVNVCDSRYVHSRVWIENGTLMAKTGGRACRPYGPKPVCKSWMCVGCGMDRTINLIAAAYYNRHPTENDISIGFEEVFAI